MPGNQIIINQVGQSSTSWTDWAPFLISVLALGLSLWSFFWSHVRKGSIEISPTVRHYRLGFVDNKELNEIPIMNLRLPLVFTNKGAKTAVVEDLRLGLPASWNETGIAQCDQTFANLDVESDSHKAEFFTPILVDGYSSVVRFCKFKGEGVTKAKWTLGDHELKVLALLTGSNPLGINRRIWENLATCTIKVTEREIVGFDKDQIHSNDSHPSTSP